jgi:pyridine nucleotide-disulfide oxidoreductase family protein
MKKLLLLGGGHAHVHVLKTLIDTPLRDVEVTLVSPFARQVYSGMLPGWLAGHYAIEECVIPLDPLAACAGVVFLQTAATALDLARGVVTCADARELPFDIVSIDTGPMANVDSIPGAREHAITIRPIENFIDAMTTLTADIAARRESHVVFVGAGAGGVELAMALTHAHGSRVRVSMISATNTLPGRIGPRLARLAAARGIRVLAGEAAARIAPRAILLESARVIDADAIIVATGTAAAAWPREAGLATDAHGFIATNPFLQSTSHANVFAAGDCATMLAHRRPKSGVYAVRAGPPLNENLRRALRGDALKPYKPQQRSLYLVSTGGRHAIASWGNWMTEGDWVWRWKDRIDRRFVAKYTIDAGE